MNAAKAKVVPNEILNAMLSWTAERRSIPLTYLWRRSYGNILMPRLDAYFSYELIPLSMRELMVFTWTPITNNPNINAKDLENVLTTKPAHSPVLLMHQSSRSLPLTAHLLELDDIPMIDPLLICLTAPGLKCPFLTTGTCAFRLYESPDNIGPESRRIGLW
jgi:hypothetical protein